jgi:hypothetical protein
LARVALLPVVGIAAPFAQAVISLVKPAFVPRYLMYALAPLLIGAVAGYEGLVRRAVSAERPKVVGLTFAAVALVVAGAITFPYSTMGKYLGGQDLRGAARILDSSTSATDRYLYVPDWLGSHVDYYFERPHGPGITEGAELDALPSGSRVWVTNSATEFESDLEQQLLARGVIGSKHELAGITVYEVVLTDN